MDMLVYNFVDREWQKLKFAGYQGSLFYLGAACTVLLNRKADAATRKVSAS